MIGYIYITTNLVNGRQYIGLHVSPTFDENYKGSGTVILEAIEKYGWDNFECHILESINNVPTICETLDDLYYSEWYYIKYYNCVKDRHYYNLKEGGTGGSEPGVVCLTGPDGTYRRVNPNTQPELFESLINKGYIKRGPEQSQETRDKRSKSITGTKRSEETRKRLSASLTGKNIGRAPWNRKKVINLDTNEVFDSVKLASESCGGNVAQALCKGFKAGGYNWDYYVE